MVLPYVEVSHLASSTSFYASILQPLGLRYLATDREETSSVGTVTYGIPAGPQRQGQGPSHPVPVLQIRETTHPFEPLKFSFLVLAAPSSAAVVEFHDCASAANPWLQLQAEGDGAPGHPSGPGPRHHLGIEGGVSPGRATVRDLDGNTIQVVCSPPSSRQDIGRVLDWKFDTASRSKHSRNRSQSHPLPSSASSSASSHANKSQASFPPQPRMQQSPRSKHPGYGSVVPIAMSGRAPSHAPDDGDQFAEPAVSPRQSPSNNGLSTTTVVGALLGVAAGAALTYSMVNKDRERRPRHETEPPPLPRCSTFPDAAPSSHHKSRHGHRDLEYSEYPPKALPYRGAGAYEPHALPAPYTEEMPWGQSAFNEGFMPRRQTYPDEYPPRTLSYPQDYTPRKMPCDDSDDSDDSDEPPPREPSRRPVKYLTEEPHHSSARSTAARSTAARSSAAKSTRSTAKSAAKSTAKSTTRSIAKSVANSKAMSRAPDEIEEPRSRQSSRHSSRASTVRSRSEAPVSRSPLTVADADHRSHAGSRHTAAPPKSTHSRARSQRPQRDPERDSYFSARSRRSSTATRRPPPPAVETELMEAPEVPEAPDVPDMPKYQGFREFQDIQHAREARDGREFENYHTFQDFPRAEGFQQDFQPDFQDLPRGPELVIRSRDGSRFSVTRLSNGNEPPIIMGHSSRAPSHMSARNIPLPMSGVGISHADWDDDNVSVAPSDSISCVGSKTSRRSRRVR